MMNHSAQMFFRMSSGITAPSDVLSLARYCNNFYLGPYKRQECKPLYFGQVQIGLIRGPIEKILRKYDDVFKVEPDSVSILKSGEGESSHISSKIDSVLRDIRTNHPELSALQGWRNENYNIKASFSDPVPLLKMERSATCLFGARQYGIDINCYVNHPDKGTCLWFQKRSRSKPTWPGRWDNFVAGGLSEGYGILETAIKEANEEASVPKEIAERMTSKGCVSFFFESERGIFPQTEFVFDLELPLDFTPSVNDGEVEEFELLPTDEVLSRVLSPDMKVTSCPITIDFLFRKGYINISNEPDLPELLELTHIPLHTLYGTRSTEHGA
uniref:YJR142W n=1 Tax=Caligus clemensi TaxID=344056 RepID=C1C372_CALCM|nr:YJR142W [Caligus clemensi]